jgi:hypothetical protein
MGKCRDLFGHAREWLITRGDQNGGGKFKGEGCLAYALRTMKHDRAGKAPVVQLAENGFAGAIMADGAVPVLWERQTL